MLFIYFYIYIYEWFIQILVKKQWKILLQHLFQHAFLHEQMITSFTVKRSVSVHRRIIINNSSALGFCIFGSILVPSQRPKTNNVCSTTHHYLCSSAMVNWSFHRLKLCSGICIYHLMNKL